MPSMSMFGDWTQAGVVLQGIQTQLKPACEAQLREDGQLILDRMQEHIIEQDLPWTPLAESTIHLKDGYTDIYIDSGYLYDNIEVRRVKSSSSNVTIFVGASAWKRHPDSGLKLSDLMIYLEYGTYSEDGSQYIPPRPLIRPTWDEIEPIIKNHWKDILGELVEKVGR